MPDFNNNGDSSPNHPWPTPEALALEQRLQGIERQQSRSNKLLLELQLEHRQGMRTLGEHVNALKVEVTAQLAEVTGLLRQFLAPKAV